MNEDTMNNAKETAAHEQPVTETDEAPAEDIYTYDADDEPVNDRDFYKDYTGETFLAAKKPSTVALETAPAAVPAAAAPVAAEKAVRSVPVKEQTPDSIEEPDEQPQDQAPAAQNQIKVNRIYFVNTVISMITLCITAAAVFTGYAYLRNLEQQLGLERKRLAEIEEKQTEQEASQEPPADEYVDAVSLIGREELNEPETPDSDMVEIDKGKILTYDSYVGYSWVPVLAGVKTNQYDKTCFRRNAEDRLEYVVDGEISSYFGIDVSSHQGDINWDAVRSDGVEFAVLRIGFRGYAPEGNIKADEKFVQNYEGAHNAGIDLGVYFYSQAISVEEAVEEAEFLLEQLDGRTLEYPVVFDWEPVDTYDPADIPRTEDVMPGTLTLAAAAFCERIKDAGYDAMVYTNKKMAYIKYDLRLLENYPKWLALYNDDMTYYYDFDMWQYGFCKVDGIEGDVDADIAIIR